MGRLPKVTPALVRSYMGSKHRYQMWLTEKDAALLRTEFKLTKVNSEMTYTGKTLYRIEECE